MYRTKLNCSNVMLLHSKVKNLPRIVLKNSYLNHLFDLTSKKIEKTTELKTWKNDDNNFPYRISISDFGNFSHKFGCNLEKLITKKFDIGLATQYKTASYFQLKSDNPTALVSNVVHKFKVFVMQTSHTLA